MRRWLTQYPIGIRVTDPETARVVAICNPKTDEVVGAGCLVSPTVVLTCRHVVRSALGGDTPVASRTVKVRLIGIDGQPSLTAEVGKVADGSTSTEDLTLLMLRPTAFPLEFPTVEFATPLRHGGKTFSVLGFPDGDAQGRHSTGFLHAIDAAGLVQMDGHSPLLVQPGFSGAPVWSPEVGAFVGLVVTELWHRRVAWCIPSRVLCSFFPELPVRFRVPPADRPQVHDRSEDDPNKQLFGTVSNDGSRCLSARVRWRKKRGDYLVRVRYQLAPGSAAPRGEYVTFVTYPDLAEDGEDAYELFARVDSKGKAENEFYPGELFTVAAIGDAGDTALTLDLEELFNRRRDRGAKHGG